MRIHRSYEDGLGHADGDAIGCSADDYCDGDGGIDGLGYDGRCRLDDKQCSYRIATSVWSFEYIDVVKVSEKEWNDQSNQRKSPERVLSGRCGDWYKSTKVCHFDLMDGKVLV